MKNKLLLILAIFWLQLPFASSVFAQQWAEAMFEERRHPFGNVAIGVEAVHRFKFQNPYPEDVHIASVTSSCGCTTPFWPKSAIKFGETGEVIAKLNTDGRFKEDKSATLTVVFDRPYRAEVQLQVTSYISPDVVIKPGVADFGLVGEGKEVTKKLTLQHVGRSDWKLTGIERTSQHVHVKADRVEAGKGLVVYDIVVTMRDTMPSGYVHDMVRFITNDPNPNASAVMLPVHGYVAAPLVAKPSPFVIGFVRPGETIKKNLVLRSESPFRITKITSQDQRFQFSVSDLEHKVHVLPIEFTADASLGALSEPIVIHTTLPGEQKQLLLLTQGSVFDERQLNFPKQMIADRPNGKQSPESSSISNLPTNSPLNPVNEKPTTPLLVESKTISTETALPEKIAARPQTRFQTNMTAKPGIVHDADPPANPLQDDFFSAEHTLAAPQAKQLSSEQVATSEQVSDEPVSDERVPNEQVFAGNTLPMIGEIPLIPTDSQSHLPQTIEVTVAETGDEWEAQPEVQSNIQPNEMTNHQSTDVKFRQTDSPVTMETTGPVLLSDVGGTSDSAFEIIVDEPGSSNARASAVPSPTINGMPTIPLVSELSGLGIVPAAPSVMPDLSMMANPETLPNLNAMSIPSLHSPNDNPSNNKGDEANIIRLQPVDDLSNVSDFVLPQNTPTASSSDQSTSQSLVFSKPSVKENLLLFSEEKPSTVQFSDVFDIVDESPNGHARVHRSDVASSRSISPSASNGDILPSSRVDAIPRIARATTVNESSNIPPVPGMKPAKVPQRSLSTPPDEPTVPKPSTVPTIISPPGTRDTSRDTVMMTPPVTPVTPRDTSDARALIASLFGTPDNFGTGEAVFEHVLPESGRSLAASPPPSARQEELQQLQPLTSSEYSSWNGRMSQIPNAENDGYVEMDMSVEDDVAILQQSEMTLPRIDPQQQHRIAAQRVMPNDSSMPLVLPQLSEQGQNTRQGIANMPANHIIGRPPVTSTMSQRVATAQPPNDRSGQLLSQSQQQLQQQQLYQQQQQKQRLNQPQLSRQQMQQQQLYQQQLARQQMAMPPRQQQQIRAGSQQGNIMQVPPQPVRPLVPVNQTQNLSGTPIPVLR